MARVLAVLNLVQSRGRWNAKSIADELGCSERTIYRDLEVLEFAGVPWYFDEQDQCYRVRSDYKFPALGLTEDELLGHSL
jgi:predicted DNA-binding transcriptional regulator YafY